MNGRILAIDWSRGLFMIIMALDHTSLYWNHGRLHDEGLSGLFLTDISWGQFITRFISHPCAPGFMLISGMALFISMQKQNGKGKPPLSQNIHYLFRGLTLIAADFILINRLGWTFGVLACMGTCMILLTLLRFLPGFFILAASIGLLIAHPCLAGIWQPETLVGSYLANVLAGSIRLKKNLAVLYPVIPWIGFMGIGYAAARYILSLWKQGKTVLISKIFWFSGILLLILFFPLRLSTGQFYGDYVFSGGIFSQDFWLLSKYPPSLAFTFWNLGIVFIILGTFFFLEAVKYGRAALLEILGTFGRVPLFFYILHRYLYKIIPDITDTLRQYSLVTVYAVWAAGLIPLFFLCQWYAKFSLTRSLQKQGV